MAMTNGVVSVLVRGVMKLKIVAGCNGMNAPAVAREIHDIGNLPSPWEALEIAVKHELGCIDCRIICTPEGPAGAFVEANPKERYVATFNDPMANPRWEHEADYTEVVWLVPRG